MSEAEYNALVQHVLQQHGYGLAAYPRVEMRKLAAKLSKNDKIQTVGKTINDAKVKVQEVWDSEPVKKVRNGVRHSVSSVATKVGDFSKEQAGKVSEKVGKWADTQEWITTPKTKVKEFLEHPKTEAVRKSIAAAADKVKKEVTSKGFLSRNKALLTGLGAAAVMAYLNHAGKKSLDAAQKKAHQNLQPAHAQSQMAAAATQTQTQVPTTQDDVPQWVKCERKPCGR